jgi:hypothetical protein
VLNFSPLMVLKEDVLLTLHIILDMSFREDIALGRWVNELPLGSGAAKRWRYQPFLRNVRRTAGSTGSTWAR